MVTQIPLAPSDCAPSNDGTVERFALEEFAFFGRTVRRQPTGYFIRRPARGTAQSQRAREPCRSRPGWRPCPSVFHVRRRDAAGPRNATARPRFPRRPRLDAPSASAETSQSAPSSASSATASDARDDLPVRVYIEHTDAYQVVYHSNYFKFLWRAREAYVFGGGLASALRDRTGAPFDPTAAGWDHLDVVAIDDCVFARSAVLGDDLLVRTSLRGIGETTLAMRQEVVFADGGEPAFAATATVRRRRRRARRRRFRARFAAGGRATGTGATGATGATWGRGTRTPRGSRGRRRRSRTGDAEADVEADAIPERIDDDEDAGDAVRVGAEPRARQGRASTRDVLRWFERDRTEAIGGSGALSALKENDGSRWW